MRERLVVLDGMRGSAALIVAVSHSIFELLPISQTSKSWMAHLPVLNGGFAVLLFFFVSGFALSIPVVRGSKGATISIAAGRYPRLAIPVFAACLITHILLVGGGINVAGIPEFSGLYTFELSTLHLFRASLYETFFSFDYNSTYLGVLWTIQIEFVWSLLTLCLLLFNKNPYGWGVQCLISIFLLWSNSFYFMFLAGLLTCRIYSIDPKAISPTVGAIALFVGTSLIAFTGDDYTPIFLIAATLTAVGLIWTPCVATAVSGQIGQTLGLLSFPAYLMHTIVLTAVGVPIALVLAASGIPDFALIGIGVLMGTLSFASGIALVPVNTWAISVSRRIGTLAVRMCDWISARLQSARA